MPTRPLTLIVATTPSWGIGLKNSLPWHQPLKAEMAYFARITKRVLSPVTNTITSSSTSSHTHASESTGSVSASSASASASASRVLNAVIMGRKTYESIPSRFRPLKDRLNIVLTRKGGAYSSSTTVVPPFPPNLPTPATPEGPLIATSIPEALRLVNERTEQVGRVFVIGGAEVYAQALQMEECTRVLRTRVAKEFECDVYFPVDLEVDERWGRAGLEKLGEWVEEDVSQLQQEEGEITWEYQMWERL